MACRALIIAYCEEEKQFYFTQKFNGEFSAAILDKWHRETGLDIVKKCVNESCELRKWGCTPETCEFDMTQTYGNKVTPLFTDLNEPSYTPAAQEKALHALREVWNNFDWPEEIAVQIPCGRWLEYINMGVISTAEDAAEDFKRGDGYKAEILDKASELARILYKIAKGEPVATFQHAVLPEHCVYALRPSWVNGIKELHPEAVRLDLNIPAWEKLFINRASLLFGKDYNKALRLFGLNLVAFTSECLMTYTREQRMTNGAFLLRVMRQPYFDQVQADFYTADNHGEPVRLEKFEGKTADFIALLRKLTGITPAEPVTLSGLTTPRAFRCPVWGIEAMTGYKPKTTFWQDFWIAIGYGAGAIRDTFNRAFNEWKTNYEYLTEFVMVLNHLAWYLEKNEKLCNLFVELYRKAAAWAEDNLKGEELNYYYRITD